MPNRVNSSRLKLRKETQTVNGKQETELNDEPVQRRDLHRSIKTLSKAIDNMNAKMLQLEEDTKEIGEYFEYNATN